MIKDCLLKFAGGKLFEACSSFLEELHISFDRETEEPVHVADYYGSAVPKYLQDVIDKTEAAYFIGVVTDLPDFADNGLSASADSLQGKYSGLFFFAVDIDPNQKITRSELASLTRGFNRISKANPVVLFIRQGSLLTLSTCERTEYKQLWREGEKLGTVSMLRDINCLKPHHGHLEILKALGDKSYPTFDELYQHWMYVFSSKLLTERFYSELSDWYAWAVSVVRFPNNIKGTVDDGKLNSEAVIRMITRLIFVWFLYCKRLIPKEFFDEKYIYDHFLDNFTPDGSAPLLYNPEESRYYRAILQNLFFAMLNRPIVAEGKDTTDNRRFMSKKAWHGMNPDYNVNNLMRYEDDFKEGGAAEFLRLANSTVPFLNGGLFDCLDQKPDVYYDGFSEREESLKRLRVPDYLFFGGTADANLYDWYHDNKKKHVRVRGLIDLFKSYYFTVEENTPLDQEVSLDPELLGKAFENLLAAYVPETGTNARKMTGSFYTPREIVQHMVDACLVAHLKRMCGDGNEQLYRSLLSYSDDDVPVGQEMRRKIMNALYNCRVLDPACGSGAFPMGMLQQMVHVLRRIDPENTMWRELMVSRATQEAEQAFGNEDESERKSRLDDIESAFNSSVNDPDYARKLYLIEHCIYGVDIQAVAIQICKLRFFISLVVDQRPTDDASSNFGIRPLPNLEAKFVAANTLIPVDYDGTLVDQIPEVRKYKEELKELNHKIFLSRRNADKKRLKARIAETRNALSKVIADSGFVQPGVATKLAAWDMFDQNKSSDFFDPEWMFGVKGGFDIVIGNPPYIRRTKILEEDKAKYERIYKSAIGQYDMYLLFIEKGLTCLRKGGYLCYINPIKFFNSDYGIGCRKFIVRFHNIKSILDVSQLDVFENAMTYPCVLLIENSKNSNNTIRYIKPQNLKSILNIFWERATLFCQREFEKGECKFIVNENPLLASIIRKIDTKGKPIEASFRVARGLPNDKVDFNGRDYYALKSKSVDRYSIKGNLLQVNTDFANIFKSEMVILPRTVLYLKSTIKPPHIVLLDRIYYLTPKINMNVNLKYIIGLINSKLINCWFEFYYSTTKVSNNYFDLNGNQILSIPIVDDNKEIEEEIQNIVSKILLKKQSCIDTTIQESRIDYLVYHLYGLTYDEVLIVDPQPPFSREKYDKGVRAVNLLYKQ